MTTPAAGPNVKRHIVFPSVPVRPGDGTARTRLVRAQGGQLNDLFGPEFAARHGAALRDRLALAYTGRTYAEHNPDAAARYGDVPMTVVRVRPDAVVGRQ
ncbi:hypothetical protein [Nocardia callitridis]